MKFRKAIRTEEAASLTDYSVNKLRELARLGLLPAQKVNGEWLFHFPEILEWSYMVEFIDVEAIVISDYGEVLGKTRLPQNLPFKDGLFLRPF